MALIEATGTCEVLVQNASAPVLNLNPTGLVEALVETLGSKARITHKPIGTVEALVDLTGDLADIPPVATVAVTGVTTMRVNFSEAMENNLALASPSSYVFSPDPGVALIQTISATPEAVADPTYVDLVVTEMTDGGAYLLSIDPGVVDLQGSSVEEPAAFTGFGAAPQVSSATAITSTKVRVQFNEAMDDTDGSLEQVANYQITPQEAGAASVAVQEVALPNIDRTYVDLTCSEMTDGKSYQAKATGVRDSAYNPIGSSNYALFTGVGQRPEILRLEAIGRNRVDVVFNETMRDNDDIRNPARYTWNLGLSTISVLDVEGDRVKLVTTDQTVGELYTLTIDNP